MTCLVDSNVWIEFFNKKKFFDFISGLLIHNTAVTNKIILAELLPSVRSKKEREFIDCISGIESIPLSIDWDEISEIQFQSIRHGINKLGLLDIAIAQNAGQNGLTVVSINRHMLLLCEMLGINKVLHHSNQFLWLEKSHPP
ncbi:MAG: PIN domain-containing protein [Spirochaetaceae bacterium]|jgi:predicted nucleic acid-binding protein|nr:PIN domain-containing protein [Spirochaetaceae bacterium]